MALTAGKGGSRKTERWLSPPGLAALRDRNIHHVRGNIVHIYDPTLGELLQHIPPQRREVILLCYFLGFTDSEIGRLLHVDHKTVTYRRSATLRRLRELAEELDYV